MGTLLGARRANVRADPANIRGEFRIACHLTHRERADIGAASIERDAALHLADVHLFQTCGRAMFAGDDANLTSFNAVLILIMGHDVILTLCRAMIVRQV
jgi:hypothetical protein